MGSENIAFPHSRKKDCRMNLGNDQICPAFRVECNFYKEGNFRQGLVDALKFVNNNCVLDEIPARTRYLNRAETAASTHFSEDVDYPGADSLGLVPVKKFMSIDVWVTNLVKELSEDRRKVDVDVACMILCENGDCITRGEAVGTDAFVMPKEVFFKRKRECRGTNREYRKYWN